MKEIEKLIINEVKATKSVLDSENFTDNGFIQGSNLFRYQIERMLPKEPVQFIERKSRVYLDLRELFEGVKGKLSADSPLNNSDFYRGYSNRVDSFFDELHKNWGL
ncbi:MAG: hypothetical protein Q8Q04_01520 [archaeon]|nr:hypothetical protein [archaeon]